MFSFNDQKVYCLNSANMFEHLLNTRFITANIDRKGYKRVVLRLNSRRTATSNQETGTKVRKTDILKGM